MLVVVASFAVSTWPLVTSPWLVPQHQDPLFSSWRVYQWARNLAAFGAHGWFSGNIFHPAPDVLLYSDAIALPALLGAPFVLLGVPVVVVYSALVWLATLSAGLAMYACARRVSGSTGGALVAAAVFTGAPARVEHVMHLELLWTAFLPWAVLATMQAFDGERRGSWRLAAAFAGQMLSCIYYGVFLLTLWPVLVLAEWLRRKGAISRAVPVRVGAAFAAGAIVAGAYAVPYQRARSVVGERSDADMANYGASFASYLAAPPGNLVWGRDDGALPELRLSPGVVALGLAGVGLAAPSTPWVLSIAVTTAVAAEASRGSKGLVYPLLRRLAPPYRGLRVPARFGAVVLMGVALLAAVGVATLSQWVAARSASSTLTAVVLLLVVGEGASVVSAMRMPSVAPPVYAWLSTVPPTVVAHVPLPVPDALPGAEADFQYFAQYHGHRLVNGNSGFYPPSYLDLLDRAGAFPDDRAVVELRRLGVEYVLVHEQYYATREAFGAVIAGLDARADVAPAWTSTDDRGVVRAYKVLPGPTVYP